MAMRGSRAAPAAVLLGALALRLWHLGARSVWVDEGSTWTAASSSLAGLIHRCLTRDASPPLYYLLTSASLRFGTDEAHLRFPSVLASLALVWLTYRIARLAMDRGAATFAMLLTALSPYQVMYGQEARTYATVAAFAVAAQYAFARAVLFDRPRAWLAHAAFSVAALYTQSIAALAFGVQAVWVAVTRSGRRHARAWLLAQAVVAALYAPWWIASAAHGGTVSASHWYLTTPGAHGVFQVLRAVFLSPVAIVTAPAGSPLPGLDAWLPRVLAHALLVAVVAVPLLLALAMVRARTPRGAVATFAAAALFLPLVAVLAASVRVPLWLPRYFVLLTPWLSVLLALGVRRMPRVPRFAWGALLVLLAAWGLVRYDLDYSKEPWRQVSARIASVSPAGRSAVLVPFDADPFAYYDMRLGHPVAVYEVSHPDVPFADRFTPRQLDEAEAAARAHAARWDEVWVVVRSRISPVRFELARRAQAAAASNGRVQVGGEEVWNSAGGPLFVTRYARPTSAR